MIEDSNEKQKERVEGIESSTKSLEYQNESAEKTEHLQLVMERISSLNLIENNNKKQKERVEETESSAKNSEYQGKFAKETEHLQLVMEGMSSLNLTGDNSKKQIDIKELLKITFPFIIVGFINSGEDFVRLKLNARLGSKVLAASALSSTILGLMSVDNEFLVPASAMIAQSFGRNNKEETGQIVKEGWLFAAILSVPTMIGSWFAEPMLKLFGQSSELTSIVGPYTRTICFSIPAIYGIFIDTAFLQSTSKVYSLVPLSIIYTGLGIGISYLLVPGNLGFPVLGIIGSGYATLIQTWLCWAGLKVYFLTNDFKPYNLFDFHFRNFDHLKKMLKLGSPLFLLTLVGQIENFIIGIMMGWFGSKQLAINQATKAYLLFLTPLIFGISQSIQIKVSQFKGKKDYNNMKYCGNLGIMLKVIFSTIPLIIYAAVPIALARFFIPKEELDGFETFIRITFITKALSNFLGSIQGQAVQNLNGLLDTLRPSIIQLLTGLVVVLPLSYIMGFVFKWNLIGINISAVIGLGISTTLLLKRWHEISHNEKHLDGIISERLGSPEPSLSNQNNVLDQGYARIDDTKELIDHKRSAAILPLYTISGMRSNNNHLLQGTSRIGESRITQISERSVEKKKALLQYSNRITYGL